MKAEMLMDFMNEVESEQEYDGYYYSLGEALTIVVLGSLCGLKNVSQIHQWAESDRIREWLKEKFAIERVPCYYWLLCLLKMVKTESLNRCLREWVSRMIPEERNGLTLAVDGKTVRSTDGKKGYQRPLHIISAQLSELGLTLTSKSVDGKSNEIPAVQELLRELDIAGCLVVADALNCQKETAKTIISGKGDYLLSVKENHPSLVQDIRDYVEDLSLRNAMLMQTVREKNRDRVEERTAFVTNDISWLAQKDQWAGLACIGAIHTEFQSKTGKSSEWHYYISSRPLSAADLLHHARMEWAVETMHWFLDVHFGEDYLRVSNKTILQNMNLLRKFSLDLMKQYKSKTGSKRALSKLMFDCLLDCNMTIRVLSQN